MAFKIIRDDITKVKADAIVNTANPRPEYGRGTDGAIYAAAGAGALLEERRKIGRMEVGEAAVTPAFALPAKYIIHTVGPSMWSGRKNKSRDLRKCYENCLKLAAGLKCESIAFPLISTGVYAFPKEEALEIAVSVFRDFLSESDMEIILVVFDGEPFRLSGKLFTGIRAFIDEKYASEKIREEYDGSPFVQDHYGQAVPRSDYLESLSDESTEFTVRPAPQSRPEDRRRRGYKADASVSYSKPSASMDFLRDRVKHVSDTWQENLLHLIDEKGFTDTEVYKRANVDRKLFSKIRGNAAYQPKKITAVAFALALRLNLDETRDFLSRAGYAFSPSSVFDLIVEYFIENEVYDTYTINLALFEHGQQLLGA